MIHNVSTKINGLRRVARWQRQHADARKPLAQWSELVQQATWGGAADVAATFGRSADRVTGRGYVCWVFNTGGNKDRLIAAVDFELQAVTPRLFMTHAESDKNRWKDQL